jgi:hypothetical protein
MADISITGRGIYRIESLSEEGTSWMIENVVEADNDEAGGVIAYVDSTPYATDIANGASDEGLEVDVNGKPYNFS